MAQTIAIVGESADGKPLPHDFKAKVQDALKKTITEELIPTVSGVVPARHASVTHLSIVFS